MLVANYSFLPKIKYINYLSFSIIWFSLYIFFNILACKNVVLISFFSSEGGILYVIGGCWLEESGGGATNPAVLLDGLLKRGKLYLNWNNSKNKMKNKQITWTNWKTKHWTYIIYRIAERWRMWWHRWPRRWRMRWHW